MKTFDEWWNEHANDYYEEHRLPIGPAQAARRAWGGLHDMTQNILQPVFDEIKAKLPGDLDDESWNPECHIEITITVAEARKIRDLCLKAL